MKAADYRDHMSEVQFTSTVVALAHQHGWLVAHFRPARTSKGWRTPMTGDPGFPDLVLARDGRVIFAELKVGTGRLHRAQRAWAEAIGCAYVWYPHDLDDIIGLLR